MPDFPTAVPDIVDANPTETLFTMHGGPGHVASTNRILANLRAFATKLGLNNGTGPPASGAVLKRTALGESGWGPVTDAELGGGHAITKLAHVGLNNVLKGGQSGTANVAGPIVSADIQDLTIVNGDIAAAAGIVVSKLNAGGVASKVVGTADGVAVTWSDIAAFIAANSVPPSALQAGGTANRVMATANGTTTAMQQVVTAMLAANAVTVRVASATGSTAPTLGATGTPAAIGDPFVDITIPPGQTADIIVFASLEFTEAAAGYVGGIVGGYVTYVGGPYLNFAEGTSPASARVCISGAVIFQGLTAAAYRFFTGYTHNAGSIQYLPSGRRLTPIVVMR